MWPDTEDTPISEGFQMMVPEAEGQLVSDSETMNAPRRSGTRLLTKDGRDDVV